MIEEAVVLMAHDEKYMSLNKINHILVKGIPITIFTLMFSINSFKL